jgi:hypothetical protein
MTKDFVAPKKVTLPDRAEMLRRLTGVESMDHLVKEFYPLIIKRLAGRETDAYTINLALSLAISDYQKKHETLPGMELVQAYQKAFVTAIVDDDQVRNLTHQLIDQVREQTRRH